MLVEAASLTRRVDDMGQLTKIRLRTRRKASWEGLSGPGRLHGSSYRFRLVENIKRCIP